jgi:hypothetical protein
MSNRTQTGPWHTHQDIRTGEKGEEVKESNCFKDPGEEQIFLPGIMEEDRSRAVEKKKRLHTLIIERLFHLSIGNFVICKN